MGLAFMCAEKILGLFKKRVRPEKKHKDRKNTGHDKTGLFEDIRPGFVDTSDMVCNCKKRNVVSVCWLNVFF